MIVCLCSSLSEEDIKIEIQEGRLTLENLQEWFGESWNCGMCVSDVIKMIKKEEKKR